MSRRLAYAPAETTPSSDPVRQQIWPVSPPGGWFRFAGDSEANAFGPLEHLRALHPRNDRNGGRRHGHVFFGQRVRDSDRDWRQWTVDVAEAPHIAKDTIDRGAAVDFYVSMQAFRGRRRLENLASIGCAFCDIDYRKKEQWVGRDPRVVLTAILATLGEVKIPPPSFVMDTGRGLCLIWLHELLPPAALRRWNLVQDRINVALAEFEADANARDAARVFRVAGSIHSEAERHRRRVRLFWIQGSPGEPFRYSFDALADQMLPYTREQLVSLRAERAKRRASGKGKAGKPSSRLDRASYGEAVLVDLERLRTHRHADGIIPAGRRDVWLFCASMALAWSCHPQALESEIIRIAARAAGLNPREAKNQMGAVIRRARDAAAGKTISFAGKKVDPRYRMKAATIARWLGITADEQRDAGLRILLDPDVRRERKAQCERERRQNNGATSRKDAQAERLRVGRGALYRMAKEGLTRDEMAAELGVSTGYLSKALREAREAA